MTEFTVNAPRATVTPRDDLRALFTAHVAGATLPSGERIDVSTVVGQPFRYLVIGAKLVAEIDFSAVVQEAILHVATLPATKEFA